MTNNNKQCLHCLFMMIAILAAVILIVMIFYNADGTGDLATWIGGVGTIAAVAASTYFAISEIKRKNKEKEELELELSKRITKALIDEADVITERVDQYYSRVEEDLKQPLSSIMRVNQEYLIVFNSNGHHISIIENDEFRLKLLSWFYLAKSCIDSISTNNELAEEFNILREKIYTCKSDDHKTYLEERIDWLEVEMIRYRQGLYTMLGKAKTDLEDLKRQSNSIYPN